MLSEKQEEVELSVPTGGHSSRPLGVSRFQEELFPGLKGVLYNPCVCPACRPELFFEEV